MNNEDLLDELLQHVATPGEDNEAFAEENLVLAPLIEEINLINDQGIRLFVRAVLLATDDEFWDCPSGALNTGHPPDEHKENGNILHTKRVVRTAILMADSQERTALERDIIIAACLLHDVTKVNRMPDGSVHIDVMHPYTVDLLVRELKKREETTDTVQGSTTIFCDEVVMFQILKAIRCHLGPWSPIPETFPTVTIEWIVHLADNIATNLHTIIDGGEIIEDRWKH